MTVVHVIPVNDIRDHVEDGIYCPCMPREDGQVITHNSYDGREIGEVCRRALDTLGSALAEHNHQWSDELRSAYEHAIAVLDMHYPVEYDDDPGSEYDEFDGDKYQ